MLLLLYKGKVEETRINSLRNTLKSVTPAKNTESKLASKAQCPDLNDDATYVGQIGRIFSERVLDHSGRDVKSQLYKHAEKTGHENVNIYHFEILSNGYKNNKFKRKLVEPLYIKVNKSIYVA